MLRVDIGCGDSKPEGFVGVDICPGSKVDIVADISKEFPFENSTVDELRAYDVVEHLPDRINTMNEIWRVCKPGARVDILVPSTDGRGAFQDPTHISFWNINSFRYYCIEFPAFFQLCQKYGFKGAFKIVSLEHRESPDQVIHVKAVLEVIKPSSEISLLQQTSNPITTLPPSNSAPTDSLQSKETVAVTELIQQIEEYHKEPEKAASIHELRITRQQLAQQWLELPVEQLEQAFNGVLGQMQRLLLDCNIQYEPLTGEEKRFIEPIIPQIQQGFQDSKSLAFFLAMMLYCRADQVKWDFDLEYIPTWLYDTYFKFILKRPLLFQELGEAENYYYHMSRWVNYLHQNITQNAELPIWQEAAARFSQLENFLPVYFNEFDLKEIYQKRGEILEWSLRQEGFEIDYDFPPRSEFRKKIKLGILAGHLAPAAETFAALPLYEYLSREFEVILYVLQQSGYPLEEYCISCANGVRFLPDNLQQQVEMIRSDGLDVLFIATNVTMVTNPICKLALHRLARIQIAGSGSVTTTGIPNIDYYLSGDLTDTAEAEEHYTETLLRVSGSAQRFSYGTEVDTSTLRVSRSDLEIPKEATVFVSAANMFKILPETMQSWAKIIASVPDSVLLLFPFGPNWAKNYPKFHFTQRFKAIFSQYNIATDRLIIADPKPTPDRNDLKAYLKLADIYLDSYPFAGTSSLIEPLEVFLPTIAYQGNCFRSRMGSALLQFIGMEKLVAENEEKYVQIAIELGNNADFRHQVREQLKQKMLNNPGFLDSHSYAKQIAPLFKTLVDTHQAEKLRQDYRLRSINLIASPDWNQPEEDLLASLTELLRSILTHPDRSHITLLITINQLDQEIADEVVGSVIMQLLTEEELEISGEEPEISLLGNLSLAKWQMLLPYLSARIPLEQEDIETIDQLQEAMTLTGKSELPIYEL